jgi:adenosylcobyric acid synthase
LRVGAIRLPRTSNSTDIEALACEPGVVVRWVSEPADLADVDVIVIPGSKATVADLNWLRIRGLADAIVAHAGSGGVVLGICGGFQMLCRRIEDVVESRCGVVEGLGLLDADIVFATDKELRRWDGPLIGYEIHHGRLARCAEAAWFEADGVAQGYARGGVFGTHWHGLLDNDEFRRNWLTAAAVEAGRPGFRVAPDVSVPARRDAQLDVMADLLNAHLDLDGVLGLLNGGPPVRPILTTTVGPRP